MSMLEINLNVLFQLLKHINSDKDKFQINVYPDSIVIVKLF